MGPVVRYTFLGFQLLGRLDDGELLSMDAVWAATQEGGDVFALLENSFGSRIDLSLYDDPTTRLEMQDVFEGISNAVLPGSFALAGNNGLVFLVAFCFQALQQDSPELS